MLNTKQRSKRWHKALAGLRAKINKDVAAVKQLKKQHEGNQIPYSQAYPHHEWQMYATWEHFCNAGQVLITTHRKSVVRLSLGSYERGLALLNAICDMTAKCGYEVTMADKEERLRLSRAGAHVEVRLAERMKKLQQNRLGDSSQPSKQLQVLTPTGRLALTIEQQGVGQVELLDQHGNPLEDQLTEILSAIAQQHQRSLAHVAELARRKREIEKIALSRREQESKDREALERADEEARHRTALITEVEDWHRAEMIRAYISVLDERLANGICTTEGYENWREWARRVADNLDQSNRWVGGLPTITYPTR